MDKSTDQKSKQCRRSIGLIVALAVLAPASHVSALTSSSYVIRNGTSLSTLASGSSHGSPISGSHADSSFSAEHSSTVAAGLGTLQIDASRFARFDSVPELE